VKVLNIKSCCLIILIITVLVLGSCGMRKEKDVKETVHLGEIARSILNGPVYIAASKGFFKEENLQIEFTTFNNNTELAESLANNTTQIILSGPQISIINPLEDPGSKLINFAQLAQKDTSFLLGRKPIENFEWSSLQKKIIIGGIDNSTPQLTLQYLLIKNELHPYKQVDVIQNIPKKAAIGAFKGGIGDFIHLLEPDVSLLEEEGTASLAVALGDEIGEIAYTTFITKTKYLEENGEIIHRFARALYKAQLWCTYHTPQEIAQELISFLPNISPDIILSVVNRYHRQEVWCPNPIIKQEALEKMEEILVANGVIGNKMPFDKIADNSFAQKAVDEIPIPKEYLKKP